jgi:hypothetical protein
MTFTFTVIFVSAGVLPREGAAGLRPSPNAQTRNLKDTDFVGTVISNVLCDLPFSKN